MVKRNSLIGILLGLVTTVAMSAPVFALSIGSNAQAANGAATTMQATNTARACLQYTNHVYEVCYAYLVNSSLGALLPYYTYAHSSDPFAADLVAFHLNERYVGQANSLIKNRVAAWPAGSTNVNLPVIRIKSVTSSLATNTATLHTIESWKVTTGSGQVLFQETNTPHTIIMHRVPSYILHKWVVSDIN